MSIEGTILISASTFIAGWLSWPIGAKIARKYIPRYVIGIEYEAILGEKRERYVFFIRQDKSVRGNEDYAKRFWTYRGAQNAAAAFKLLEAETKPWEKFRLVDVRVIQVGGMG